MILVDFVRLCRHLRGRNEGARPSLLTYYPDAHLFGLRTDSVNMNVYRHVKFRGGPG